MLDVFWEWGLVGFFVSIEMMYLEILPEKGGTMLGKKIVKAQFVSSH